MPDSFYTEDLYVVAITALLPLTACMVVVQVNPYHALVIRGILGAVAALVYALFGAADVALTEALVGTMLSITLYAIAVRSSMSMRLGVLTPPAEPMLSALQKAVSKYHLRLEIVSYTDLQTLQKALVAREVHTILQPGNLKSSVTTTPSFEDPPENPPESARPYLQTRVQRLHEIMQAELSPTLVNLGYRPTSPDGIKLEKLDQMEHQP
ncbi:MAG: DUF4040 domain-containing protein [Cyanobacteria bacterium J06635_15]